MASEKLGETQYSSPRSSQWKQICQETGRSTTPFGGSGIRDLDRWRPAFYTFGKPPPVFGQHGIVNKGDLGGGNSSIFLLSPLKLGEDEPILTVAYFSNGLVQSPTRHGNLQKTQPVMETPENFTFFHGTPEEIRCLVFAVRNFRGGKQHEVDNKTRWKSNFFKFAAKTKRTKGPNFCPNMYRTEAAIILQQEVLDSIVCFVLFCFVLFSCVLFCFVLFLHLLAFFLFVLCSQVAVFVNSLVLMHDLLLAICALPVLLTLYRLPKAGNEKNGPRLVV